MRIEMPFKVTPYKETARIAFKLLKQETISNT